MQTVRYVVTAPFRGLWFLITLPYLLLAWLLLLVKRCLLAIFNVPVYYLGRARTRAAVAWEWTKETGRARLALPWWGRRTSPKATQSTQTLDEDEEDDDDYSTPMLLSRPSSGYFDTSSLRRRVNPELVPELLLKLQREARRRSTSSSQRRKINALLELLLQQDSPVSSPGDSEREDPQGYTGASGGMDKSSLSLILDLMSISNTAGGGEEEAHSRKAREKQMYSYDRERLQEYISELDRVSFETSGHKKSKRGKGSARHSRQHQRHHRSAQSPPHHPRSHHSLKLHPPRHESDSESASDDEACVTAEDYFSDEEDPHTSEYHSPLEDMSVSEEEEEEERVRSKLPAAVMKRTQAEGGKGERERRKPRSKRPVKVAEKTPSESVETVTAAANTQPEERQRSGSERLCSFSGGILSPVQESPEYARTPSTGGSGGSADELEIDLNRALSQLDSETSGLQADAREVEYIEQKAAAGGNQSSSPSPLSSNAPPTPNTVVWERGKCVEISSTLEVKSGEQEEQDGEIINEEREGEKEGEEEREGEKEREGGDLDAVPKVAPSLGLKVGHDRQQLAVVRSSARRRPPSRHTNSQDENSAGTAGEMMAADPEMERLEKQLQQSVDSLSNMLDKKERSKEAGKGQTVATEKRESEEEDDDSEGDLLERKISGGGPSLADQMSLLSPGAGQQLAVRDLSPASTLEDSLDLATTTPGPSALTRTDEVTPATTVSSRRVATSTSSSPGAPLSEERLSRPRSQSCDSQQRHRGPGSASPGEKPLMIPSSQPPWMEMRKISAAPLQPLPITPPVHTLTQQPVRQPRSRAASHPPIMDPVYDVLPTQTPPPPAEEDREEARAETAGDDEEIYDTLQPADERIYEITPIRYLHQGVVGATLGVTPGSPTVLCKPLKVKQEEDGRREERKSRSSEEKTHSSRGKERERGRERERHHRSGGREEERGGRRYRSHSSDRTDSRHSKHRERDRDRERGRDRDRERGRDRDREGGRDRDREKDRNREREGHSSRHHTSSSDRHSSSSSSRKHGSKSGEHRKEESSSRRHSSKEREKERGKEKEKEKDRSIIKGLRFSFRSKGEKSGSGKGELEKSSRSSGRSSRHHHRDEGAEDEEGKLHRTPSRYSVVSTSALSSSKEPHPDALKKTTSLSSLSFSGSSQGSPLLSPDHTRDALV